MRNLPELTNKDTFLSCFKNIWKYFFKIYAYLFLGFCNLLYSSENSRDDLLQLILLLYFFKCYTIASISF